MASSDDKRAVSAENAKQLAGMITKVESLFTGSTTSFTLPEDIGNYLYIIVNTRYSDFGFTCVIDPKAVPPHYAWAYGTRNHALSVSGNTLTASDTITIKSVIGVKLSGGGVSS